MSDGYTHHEVKQLEEEIAFLRKLRVSHEEQIKNQRNAITSLVDIVNQIRGCNPIDDHRHDFKLNMAYLKAEKLLDELSA